MKRYCCTWSSCTTDQHCWDLWVPCEASLTCDIWLTLLRPLKTSSSTSDLWPLINHDETCENLPNHQRSELCPQTSVHLTTTLRDNFFSLNCTSDLFESQQSFTNNFFNHQGHLSTWSQGMDATQTSCSELYSMWGLEAVSCEILICQVSTGSRESRVVPWWCGWGHVQGSW